MTSLDEQIFAAAEMVRADLQSPVRRNGGSQVPSSAGAGGPVEPPVREAGEGSTPGPAVVPASAARESSGPSQAGAGDSFRLPPVPTVPSFVSGSASWPRARRSS